MAVPAQTLRHGNGFVVGAVGDDDELNAAAFQMRGSQFAHFARAQNQNAGVRKVVQNALRQTDGGVTDGKAAASQARFRSAPACPSQARGQTVWRGRAAGARALRGAQSALSPAPVFAVRPAQGSPGRSPRAADARRRLLPLCGTGAAANRLPKAPDERRQDGASACDTRPRTRLPSTTAYTSMRLQVDRITPSRTPGQAARCGSAAPSAWGAQLSRSRTSMGASW